MLGMSRAVVLALIEELQEREEELEVQLDRSRVQREALLALVERLDDAGGVLASVGSEGEDEMVPDVEDVVDSTDE